MGGNLSFLASRGLGISMSPQFLRFRAISDWKGAAEGHTLQAAEVSWSGRRGVNTLQLVYRKCREDVVTMPILSALYDVIFGGKPVPRPLSG